MESSETVTYLPHNSKKRVFSAEAEVIDIDDLTAKTKAKGKQKEVAHHDIIDVDMYNDYNDVVLLEGKVESGKKTKRSMGISLGSSSSTKVESSKKGKEISVELGHFHKGFNPGLNNFFDLDDYVHDDDFIKLQSHFDKIDFPAGIEASIPFMPDLAPKKKENTVNVPSYECSSSKKSKSSFTKLVDDKVRKRYEGFKKFDTVADHSDHYFGKQYSAFSQPPKNWAKRIEKEWRILEKDLPDTIFVRVYESRMDILRAAIIGAEGTPYHDGLFFFDVFFPIDYTSSPPLVHYHSGGLNINPNLYDCGKVCLSLLNTWEGQREEKWLPGKSTMLQVLVSIQGLILNMKPFYNEPYSDYEEEMGTVYGESESLQYNEDVLILSLKTMVYTMNKPPKNFEDLVIGHFQHHARDILMACKAYTEGAQVGSLVKGGLQDVDEGNNTSCSPKFKHDLGSYIKTLIAAFKKIGAKEAEGFQYLSVNKSYLLPATTPIPPANALHYHTHAYKYNQYW